MPSQAVARAAGGAEKGFQLQLLIALLRLESPGVPVSIRTVGLSEALSRIGRFVRSKASKDDLQTLIDLRNGIVHAAENTEVEERILAAFVQQVDSLLTDFGGVREDFWDGQLAVVNALLADATDKLAHRVEVRLAAAEAMIERRYETEGEAVIRALRALSKSVPLRADQRFRDCPVCGADGIATGEHTVEWDSDDSDKAADQVTNLWVKSGSLRRNSSALCAACDWPPKRRSTQQGWMETAWEIEGADWREYEQQTLDEDASYERWREERGDW